MSKNTGLLCSLCGNQILSDQGFITISRETKPDEHHHKETCSSPLRNHQVKIAYRKEGKMFQISEKKTPNKPIATILKPKKRYCGTCVKFTNEDETGEGVCEISGRKMICINACTEEKKWKQ